MLKPMLTANDRLARIVILTLSVVVFIVVVALGKYKLLDVELPFDRHIFATINACINSVVAILLLVGLYAVKQRNFLLHRNTMMLAILLSALFLVSYIAHHIFNPDTYYPNTGFIKTLYLVILILHIVSASLILPFILFTAYRGLTGEYQKHTKLARITYPIWLYVAISGVVVYLMISPYY